MLIDDRRKAGVTSEVSVKQMMDAIANSFEDQGLDADLFLIRERNGLKKKRNQVPNASQ